MGQKLAAYNAQGAITAFYDSADSPVPDGANAIEIADAEWQACLSAPGYAVVSGALVAPTPPTAAQIAAQQAAQALASAVNSAIAAGVTITSSGTPAISGTYAVDSGTQTKIASMMLGIQVNGTFPGGNTAYPFPDASGAFHTFPSVAVFKAFATAIDNFVAQLDLYAADAPGVTLPAATVTIA